MRLTEHRIDELTRLRFRIFTCPLSAEEYPFVLILSFSGELEAGTAGNLDAEIIRVFTLAAVSLFWETQGVIFDFRELDYKMGNAIWNVFGHGIKQSGVEHLPCALVVSDLCRQGFSSCPGLVPPMFDDLESALKCVSAVETEQVKQESPTVKKWWEFWK